MHWSRQDYYYNWKQRAIITVNVITGVLINWPNEFIQEDEFCANNFFGSANSCEVNFSFSYRFLFRIYSGYITIRILATFSSSAFKWFLQIWGIIWVTIWVRRLFAVRTNVTFAGGTYLQTQSAHSLSFVFKMLICRNIFSYFVWSRSSKMWFNNSPRKLNYVACGFKICRTGFQVLKQLWKSIWFFLFWTAKCCVTFVHAVNV